MLLMQPGVTSQGPASGVSFFFTKAFSDLLDHLLLYYLKGCGKESCDDLILTLFIVYMLSLWVITFVPVSSDQC